MPARQPTGQPATPIYDDRFSSSIDSMKREKPKLSESLSTFRIFEQKKVHTFQVFGDLLPRFWWMEYFNLGFIVT